MLNKDILCQFLGGINSLDPILNICCLCPNALTNLFMIYDLVGKENLKSPIYGVYSLRTILVTLCF
jgi:hypothetical protein